MPFKNPSQRLRDIVDNIDAIEMFTTGMDLEAFASDRKTVYAVVRALGIVSEASTSAGPVERCPREYRHKSDQSIESVDAQAIGRGNGRIHRVTMRLWAASICCPVAVAVAWKCIVC